MSCTIVWNGLSPEEWDRRFAVLPRSTFLQSYDYARAVCALQKQKARFGLIQINGKEAGLVQILETGILWDALHTVILDRGPLWFEGFGGAAHIRMFFDEFNRRFPPRFGRKRRVLPEIEDGMTARKMLESTGLRRMEGREGYQTIWMDLGPEEEARRAALKSNWRNKLNKSERSGLEIEWDERGMFFPWLLKTYALDKKIRGYDGPSPQFLDYLAKFLSSKGNMLIGRALLDGRPVACVLFISHGRSATYQVGWSSEEGRRKAAHHLLLWDGTARLREKGICEVDLGGVNDESAAGVKTFKEGLGGQGICLVGHYF
ncbi:MAG: GNAT family N-acetyltransferase [Rhodospirillales bacterium]|nr:GNAT family N-acetyltransferase [Alphaproteobacteria bacterium]USO03898.1 MAG: GNAT family N-acetyltransferase [Rhodospirillales bacterium]